MRLLVLLSSLAFISLGLPDGLLGVAWPSMRATFGRDLDDLGLLLLLTTFGAAGSSFASGRLIGRMNLGKVLALSGVLTSLALAGYALAFTWWLLLPLALILGLGGGAIDAALNTYVASNHGPRALNWLHACYGVGAATGPMIMTMVLQTARPWQWGYAIVAIAQATLAVAFIVTFRQWPRMTSEEAHAGGAPLGATLRLPMARRGILTFVAYSGVEASYGVWTYTFLTAGRGIDPALAGTAVSLFWGGLTAGRVVAASVGARLSGPAILHLSLGLVVVATLGLWMNAGTSVTLWSVAIAGLACGPIFPTLIALTPARVGAIHAGNAVGVQIAAGTAGISIIPAIVGVIAERWGVETIASLLLGLAVSFALVCRAWERAAMSSSDATP